MGPRRGRWVAGVGALVVAVGLVGTACVAGGTAGGGGGGQGGGPAGRPGLGCGPGTPVPGGELPTSPTTVPEAPATTMPGTPWRPSPIVAVGADGAVVVLDSTTGERTVELAPVPASGAVVGVTLSPDGDTAWFDVCRPGRPGSIYVVPTDGSAPARRVATGSYPEVSPTGDRLAYIAGRSVVVWDLATGTERRWADSGTGRLAWLAWTGDGGLVWVRGESQLVLLAVDTPGAEPRAVPGAVAGPGEVMYATLRSSVLVGDGPDDPTVDRIDVGAFDTVSRRPDTGNAGGRDRAFDASGQWGLRTDAYGNIVWSVGGGVGLVAEDYVAADW
jgi:hypothetical protein